MSKIELVVFDMSGTTIKDDNEVVESFIEAAKNNDLKVEESRVNSMMGYAKKSVFETLWQEQIGKDDPSYLTKVETSYADFKKILEDYYKTQAIAPAEGCLEIFSWLKTQGIKIALNTGFYREVTDIILSRLGWDIGLNQDYIGSENSLIQASITPSEIYNNEGRPAPFMIQKAMYRLGVNDAQKVIYLGDTPVDLESGKNANCLLTFGVTNGSHTREELDQYPHDGLLASLTELPAIITNL